MNFMKKLVSIICVISIVFSLCSIVASANDKVVINNDNPNFSELVIVEGGKTYLPLRLVFPNLNDMNNRKALNIAWGKTFPVIHLIYGETNGEDYTVLENNVTKTPFIGTRKCVDIMWEGDPETGARGEATVIEYIHDENGEMEILEERSGTLSDKIYLKYVSGGARMFVSIDDINKIAGWLGIDDEYSVTLR